MGWVKSATETPLGLIKQTTGKDVKIEAVIDFTLLRQVAGTKMNNTPDDGPASAKLMS